MAYVKGLTIHLEKEDKCEYCGEQAEDVFYNWSRHIMYNHGQLVCKKHALMINEHLKNSPSCMFIK